MLTFLNLLLLICSASGARILGVVLTPSYSHQIVFKPLWRELSLRGHQVTTITTHPIKDPSLVNLTEIDLSNFLQHSADGVKRIIEASNKNFLSEIHASFTMMYDIVDTLLSDPSVKELINDKNAKFDLVIGEYLWFTVFAFAERFNCPSIGMLTIDASSYMYKKIGSPTHSSIYPDMMITFQNGLSLYERVISFLFSYGFGFYMDFFVTQMDQKVIEKHFGSHYSPVQDLAGNISLLFVNADPVFHPVRPLVPAVIQIGGGSYISPPKPLPKELKNVLDEARTGFIYFSLGSNVQSEYLPPKTIEMMLEVFSELPYTILWKFGEEITNKPKNVVISKWLPQLDVLAHPNIKLFITQGGLQSMDEAIYSHVPMIGLPFFGDQPINVKRIVYKGIGLELDYKTITKIQFKETILEVINNPKYRNTVKSLAKLAQDQPMTGMEKAVWWSEYVIRHKGARHLRSPLLDIPLYQYLLFDVIGVLLLTILVILYLIYFIIKLVVKCVKSKCCKKRNQRKRKIEHRYETVESWAHR